jgi:outer membrane protein OmpA-like peptidoglycan-associated protein
VNVTTGLRRCAAALAGIVVAASLAGCGASADGAQPVGPLPEHGSSFAGALAIVVGARNNVPPPVLAGRAASAREMALTQQSHVSLVVADGAPAVQGTFAVPLLEPRDGADTEQQREANRRRVDEAVAAARAATPESDLLAALDVAARSMETQPGPHTVVILDSGLSTSGALNFRQPGLLDADPQELADTLSDAQQLPDVTGASVIFQGLGEVVRPQQPLERARRTQLASIWTAVLKEAGALAVVVDHPPLDGSPPAGLPPVTPVSIDAGVNCAGTTVTLSGGDLAFQPGSAELLDPEAAVEVLRPLATQIIDRRLTAIVFGTYASVGDPAARVRISDRRAQTVADVLIDHGVPIPQLHVEGLGSDFADYVPDRDPEGRLLPVAAALNRKIFIELTGSVSCG